LPADSPQGDRYRSPRGRRATAVAAATAVAVGLAAAVGTLAAGGVGIPPTAVGAADALPAWSAGPGAVRTVQAGATPAGGPPAAASVTPTPGTGAPTGPPTGTGAVGGSAPAATPSARRAAAAGQPADGTAAGTTAAEAAVLVLVNQERAKANCGPLSADARLTAAARAHSADMAGRGYFAHDTPDGVGVGTRVTGAGYRWSAVGENIAQGQQTPAAVMQAWMNSPGHRANILNCRFSNIGIGLARPGRSPLWTQDFGTPAR
jgi:uncharacterized protein YkwD